MKGLAILVASGLLAVGTGFLAATALSTGKQTPAFTTTITLTNGATGPTGPAGPEGPPGGTTCPEGFQYGEVVIDHPGGHVNLLACMQRP